jgi:tetratricopeptide (TPR) repeat protein
MRECLSFLSAFEQHDPLSLQQQLISAASDEDLTRLLEAHRPLITRDFGLQGLAEVHAMSSGPQALPGSMLVLIAPRITDVVEHIARFLGDDPLRAECHFERSRVFAVGGQYEAAIDELRAAAALWAQLGDRLREAQCIGQIGTFQLQLGLLDEAEVSLNASVALLGAGETDQALLAPTYEELAQIAGRKHNMRATADYLSRAARIRLRQERYAQAAFDFQASVPLWLTVDDGRSALENAEQFLQLRESGQSESTSAVLDQEFAEIVARYSSELTARAAERRDPLRHADWQPGSGEGLQQDLDAAVLDAARRWITLARRCIGLTKDPEPIAHMHFASAFLSLLDSDPAAAAEESALALPFF